MQETAEPCYCGKIRYKYVTGLPSWLCHQCWKIQRSEVYYQCGDCPNCMNVLGDQCCNVCELCAFVPSMIHGLSIANAVRTSLDTIERQIATCETAEETVDYLFVVHNEFHRSWIALVRTTDYGSNEDFMMQFNRYQTMRSTALQQQQVLIDEMQLMIEDNVLPMKQPTNNTKFSSNAQNLLLSQLTKEWEDLVGTGIMEFDNVACNHRDKCPSWKRVLFINNLFEDHFIKPMIQKTVKLSNAMYVDLFQKCLSEHSAVSLLDDVYHIESMHNNDDNAVKCGCDDLDKECIGDLLRKYRRRERGEDEEEDKEEDDDAIFEKFMDGLDDEGRLIMDVTAKMHDALCHGYDDEKEFFKEDGADADDFKVRSLKWWKKRAPSTQKGNKFVNEVTEQKETKQKEDGGRMENLHDVLIQKGMNLSDSNRFMKYLHQNNYDSETVLDDLMDDEDIYNEYDDSNVFPAFNRSQHFAKTIKKHLGGQQNDDDELPVFSFGNWIWYYWAHYNHRDDYNQPKYGNLKEECVSNQVYSISMDLFNQTLRKAMMYQKSRKGRKLKAEVRGEWNSWYKIPIDLPITISHVFVLLLYCNFTKLQYAYKKKGCRESDDEQQTLDEFKALNSEIGHWYKLLYEVIEFFGARCTPKDTFYTGLNVRLNFSTFAPIWCAPFSTTIEIDVANRFSDGTGIILRLIPSAGSMDYYFNVEWLSDYDFEKERLFMRAHHLQIADIRYVELGKFVNNERYLRAFAFFSGLFSGHFICHLLRRKRKQPKAEKVLLDLITVYKENNGMCADNGQSQRVLISLYIQQMFFNLIQQFRSKRKHFVIKSEYDKLGSALKAELFSFNGNGDDRYNRFSEIKTSSFFNILCPSLRIQCPMEYFWIIEGQQLIDLKNGGFEYHVICDETFVYKISPSNSLHFKFKVKRPGVSSHNLGIYMQIEKTSIRGMFNATWSVRVEELNWFCNGWNFNDLKSKAEHSITAFNIDSLADLESLTVRAALRFW